MEKCVHIWLRDESKLYERRTALTPDDAAKLIHLGFQITVESSKNRIFPDGDYQKIGCNLVAAHSWKSAPSTAFILGLKELPEEEKPLAHRHIYFAHAYKKQNGWDGLLSRFDSGNGELFDLEYLVDEKNRRVAAFGHWAGYVGAALGIDVWKKQTLGIPFGPLKPYDSQEALIADVSENLKDAFIKSKKMPRTLILGALGRCGRGAQGALQSLNLLETAVLWDVQETKQGGPFSEILNQDILINTVLIENSTKPFLIADQLNAQSALSVIVDVSCDPYSPWNPLPIYNKTTSFSDPVQRVQNKINLVAIDHLPSLLPRESSEDFSAQLLPHLCALKVDKTQESLVWQKAQEVFYQKLGELRC